MSAYWAVSSPVTYGRAGLVEFGGDGAQHVDVDLGVLVLAKVVLERFETSQELLARACGEQAPEAFQEIAELLGVLAEIVDLFGGGGGSDHAATFEQHAVGAGDALGDQRTERTTRPPRHVVVERCGQPPLPRVHQGGGAFGAQAEFELDVTVAASSLEQVAHRL